MKLLALLAFGLLPVLAMTAQTEPADTVKILDNADQVVITKNGNNTIVKAVIRNAENDTSMKLYTYSVTVEENTDSAREEFSESVFLSHPLFTGKQRNNLQHRPKANSSHGVTLPPYATSTGVGISPTTGKQVNATASK